MYWPPRVTTRTYKPWFQWVTSVWQCVPRMNTSVCGALQPGCKGFSIPRIRPLARVASRSQSDPTPARSVPGAKPQVPRWGQPGQGTCFPVAKRCRAGSRGSLPPREQALDLPPNPIRQGPAISCSCSGPRRKLVVRQPDHGLALTGDPVRSCWGRAYRLARTAFVRLRWRHGWVPSNRAAERRPATLTRDAWVAWLASRFGIQAKPASRTDRWLGWLSRVADNG